MAVPESDHELRNRLSDEVRHIRGHAGEWKGGERPVQLRTKALVALVGGML